MPDRRRGVSRGLAGLLAAAVLALGACQGPEELASPVELDLTDVVAAFTMSPQASDVARGAETAILGTIDRDGELTVAAMRPMDVSSVLWTEDIGLFVSDDSADFVLGESSIRIPSEKADFQNGVIQVPGTSKVLAVYNRGYEEDGRYTDDLVVTHAGGSHRSELNGDFTVLSGSADEGVFGIGAGPGWDGRADLEDAVRTSVGNGCDVLVFTPDQFQQLAQSGEPVISDILRDGLALIGSMPHASNGAA